jgi:glycosyltransferase involved in cell wall biosynthesis
MAKRKTLLLQGNWGDRSSFSLVTERLARGLQAGFDVTVFPNNEGAAAPRFPPAPDIYLFQGFGYDLKNAPGLLNVFYLTYEYLELECKYRDLVDRLNLYFDLVVVPSPFVKRICRRSGIRVPVEVVSYGFDAAEFYPGAPPAARTARKRFCFLNLGGMFDRKGTDVLLEAYLSEFTFQDDVTLIVKARGYETAAAWAERTMRNARLERRGAPAVTIVHQDLPSISGYYTAADCGVFPHRGEGFGLPILECIACGTPVIVTGGTGEMMYCTDQNAQFLKRKPRLWAGRRMVEPDVVSLRRALRNAYEMGPLTPQRRRAVSRTVAAFTWGRTFRDLDQALRAAEKKAKPVRKGRSELLQSVTYAFPVKGLSSWKRVAREIDSLLSGRYARYHSVPFRAGLPRTASRLTIGQSEFCLEAFLQSAREAPEAVRLLHMEGTVLEHRIAVTNLERKMCGVPLITKRPIELWRNHMECRLADTILLASSVAAKYFLRAGYSADRLRVLPWGVDLREPARIHKSGKIRFLFGGTEPFRKGIRLLFEAWSMLRPVGAELWCFTSEEILQSPRLLKHIVANPSIVIRPLLPYRDFGKILSEFDCQVLPSLEDSFSLAIGDGMGCGVPGIVSRETGVADLIVNGENGLVVGAGSVAPLAAALDSVCGNRSRLRAMGEAAFQTAQRHTWEHFGREFLALTDSLLRDGQRRNE